MNFGSLPSSLSDADSQKTVSNELAVDSPSKENKLLCPKSPSFGESSLSRLEVGWVPSHQALEVLQHTLRGLGKQGSSLLASHHSIEYLQKEKEA